ncbi:NAD-dependent epimerase/dehydratase family protein [Larkinella bovis]|uniref:NAD-dependent epimerase/dehydratase family protein n=1 Tax=Larkinella bovis TaxID=683041 RepID=A0ABW0ILS6_9BACT
MKSNGVRAIITGVTGMVGEGVLLECLQHPEVEAVLIINRKPSGFSHPKLTEIVHADFYNFTPIQNRLVGYNACFFCLGVSSVGMNEKDYYRVTYTLTMHVATTLSQLNPDMTFCYVSGGGTDSTEKGRLMWARVKGKTENDLTKLPFRQVYNFRPGFLKPSEGMKNTNRYYHYIGWLYPMGRALFPALFCSLREMGQAMIKAVTKGYEKPVLEVRDIVELAKR